MDLDPAGVAVLSERTVSELKQKLRNLRDALYDPEKLQHLFHLSRARDELRRSILANQTSVEGRRPTLSQDIETCLEEIRRFDEKLKQKSTQVKEARLSRMHEEEETCQVLNRLQDSSHRAEVADAVRNNSEQYLKLVSGFTSTSDSPAPSSYITSQTTSVQKCRKTKTKPASFIERNIQLAKCGQGVLSLTDEEKLRLRVILKDVDDVTTDGGSSLDTTLTDDDSALTGSGDNLYVLTDDTRSALNDIDTKLMVYEKTKKSEYYPELRQHFIEDTGAVVDNTSSLADTESKDTQTRTPGKLKPKTESCRLKEVDKLLLGMATAAVQEINPLSEEEIQILIEEVHHWSDTLPKYANQEVQIPLDQPTQEQVKELIDTAKFLMPNFKYRYGG